MNHHRPTAWRFCRFGVVYDRWHTLVTHWCVSVVTIKNRNLVGRVPSRAWCIDICSVRTYCWRSEISIVCVDPLSHDAFTSGSFDIPLYFEPRVLCWRNCAATFFFNQLFDHNNTCRWLGPEMTIAPPLKAPYAVFCAHFSFRGQNKMPVSPHFWLLTSFL